MKLFYHVYSLNASIRPIFYCLSSTWSIISLLYTYSYIFLKLTVLKLTLCSHMYQYHTQYTLISWEVTVPQWQLHFLHTYLMYTLSAPLHITCQSFHIDSIPITWVLIQYTVWQVSIVSERSAMGLPLPFSTYTHEFHVLRGSIVFYWFIHA